MSLLRDDSVRLVASQHLIRELNSHKDTEKAKGLRKRAALAPARRACDRLRLDSTCSSFLKREQRCHRNAQPSRHYFKRLEGRRVYAAFN